jgi:hypothetical protein
MTGCAIHVNFFDDSCSACKKEYEELKGLNESNADNYKSSYDNDKAK